MKLTYGKGNLQTQQGTTHEGVKCLTIKKIDEAKPINSTPKEWDKKADESQFDLILEFRNIESARVLQDELNELISTWSREGSLTV